jgi:hypothetical protein
LPDENDKRTREKIENKERDELCLKNCPISFLFGLMLKILKKEQTSSDKMSTTQESTPTSQPKENRSSFANSLF